MTLQSTSRPYFLWDYDLSEEDVRQILHSSNEIEKIWLMSRILESARYEDVWRYLTLHEVQAMFPKLQLKPAVRQVWEYALHVWSTSETDGS